MNRLLLCVLALLFFAIYGCSDKVGVRTDQGNRNGLNVKLLRSIQAHRGYVFFVDFFPDGTVLASGGSDNAVKIWDAKSWTEKKSVIEEYHEIWGIPLAFSPDGNYLLIGAFDTLKLLDVKSDYKMVAAAKAHPRGVQSLGFSPDGSYAISAGADGYVRVWTIPDLSNAYSVKAHETEVWSAAVSPDSKFAVSGSEDSTFKIWSFPDLKELKTVKYHALPVEYVRFSHDGKMMLAASADSTISVWKTGEWKSPYRLLRGHMGSVLVAEFYTDDKLIFSGGDDDSIYSFDISSGEIVYQLKEHFGDIMTLAFSRDGKRMASGSRDRTVKIWSVDN